jgi:site-specific recombinase XerD
MMEEIRNPLTIKSAIRDYIEVLKINRSENTALTYGKALKDFSQIVIKSGINPETCLVRALTVDLFSKFIIHLNSFAPATEKLYAVAVVSFYKYLVAEQLAEFNLPLIERLSKENTRKLNSRLPQFSKNNVERVLEQSG